MLDHAEILFENMVPMMKRLKKPSYDTNMSEFRRQHDPYFKEMIDFIDTSENKEQAVCKLADDFVSQVKNHFSVKGKINPRTQADMNFFMIYYVFPAILLTESEHAGMLADAVRDKWRLEFKDSSKINYADYETIRGSFRDKIFGIF